MLFCVQIVEVRSKPSQSLNMLLLEEQLFSDDASSNNCDPVLHWCLHGCLMGKTSVPPVPEEDSPLFLAEDDFNNVAIGSAWDV